MKKLILLLLLPVFASAQVLTQHQIQTQDYNDAKYLPLTGGAVGPITGASGHFDAITTGKLSGMFIVDGSKYAQTDAGIQSAINDATTAGGGTVYLASGQYWLGSSLPITVGNVYGLRIVGAGNSTILNVCGSMGDSANCTAVPGASTDIFHIAPTGGFQQGSVVLQDFYVRLLSGAPARHLIYFDGNDGMTFGPVVQRIFMNSNGYGPTHVGSYAIYADGTALGNGNLRTALITDNELSSGIQINNSGDTARIEHNVIWGPGIGIDINYVAGAADDIIAYNNLTSLGGGIHIGAGGVQTQIIGNEIETPADATGSHGALIDIEGSSGLATYYVTLAHNSCQIINGSSLNCVRLDYAYNTEIFDNRFGRGASPSTDIVITAHATGTDVRVNKFGGTPLSKMVSDSGVGTSFLTGINGGQAILPGTFLGTFSADGNTVLPSVRLDSDGNVTLGINADCGLPLCVNGSIGNPNGVLLPSALTGYHGTGPKVQLSDGAGASGNLTKFDANGNTADAGISAAAVSALPATSGTPTAGKATCWKTASTIGYCSTVVAADGSCTCN